MTQSGKNSCKLVPSDDTIEYCSDTEILLILRTGKGFVGLWMEGIC